MQEQQRIGELQAALGEPEEPPGMLTTGPEPEPEPQPAFGALLQPMPEQPVVEEIPPPKPATPSKWSKVLSAAARVDPSLAARLYLERKSQSQATSELVAPETKIGDTRLPAQIGAVVKREDGRITEINPFTVPGGGKPATHTALIYSDNPAVAPTVRTGLADAEYSKLKKETPEARFLGDPPDQVLSNFFPTAPQVIQLADLRDKEKREGATRKAEGILAKSAGKPPGTADILDLTTLAGSGDLDPKTAERVHGVLERANLADKITGFTTSLQSAMQADDPVTGLRTLSSLLPRAIELPKDYKDALASAISARTAEISGAKDQSSNAYQDTLRRSALASMNRDEAKWLRDLQVEADDAPIQRQAVQTIETGGKTAEQFAKEFRDLAARAKGVPLQQSLMQQATSYQGMHERAQAYSLELARLGQAATQQAFDAERLRMEIEKEARTKEESGLIAVGARLAQDFIEGYMVLPEGSESEVWTPEKESMIHSMFPSTEAGFKGAATYSGMLRYALENKIKKAQAGKFSLSDRVLGNMAAEGYRITNEVLDAVSPGGKPNEELISAVVNWKIVGGKPGPARELYKKAVRAMELRMKGESGKTFTESETARAEAQTIPVPVLDETVALVPMLEELNKSFAGILEGVPVEIKAHGFNPRTFLDDFMRRHRRGASTETSGAKALLEAGRPKPR